MDLTNLDHEQARRLAAAVLAEEEGEDRADVRSGVRMLSGERIMHLIACLISMVGLLGCSASQDPVNGPHEAIVTQAESPQPCSEAILLQDGTLVSLGKLPAALDEPAAALRKLVQRYSDTHRLLLSPDGLSVAITPRDLVEATSDTEIAIVPDWRKPGDALIRRGAYASVFNEAATYMVPTPDGKWERHFIRFGATVREWTVDRDLRILDVGPAGRWVGWDGKQLQLGTIGPTGLIVDARIDLPPDTNPGYHEDVFWLRGGDLLVLAGTRREPAEKGLVRDVAAVFAIDWDTRARIVVRGFLPVAKATDTSLIGLTEQRLCVGTFEHDCMVRPAQDQLAIKDSDTVIALSRSGQMALVRDRAALRLPSAEPPFRVRHTWAKDAGGSLPNLKAQGSAPVAWINCDALPP